MLQTQIENSSNVLSASHDGKDLILGLKGGTFRYMNVPVAHYHGITTAESAGKYLNSEIKPNFKFEKVEELGLLNTDFLNGTVKALEEVVPEHVKFVGTLVQSTEGSAAYDLTTTHKILLQPGQRGLAMTGVHMEMPMNMAALITPRSGHGIKKGIGIVNSPGLIDCDYRGELGVILINHGEEAVEFAAGDRIAQMMFVPKLTPLLVQVGSVADMSATKRGVGGFGSTGTATPGETIEPYYSNALASGKLAVATPLMPRTKSA
jgi:dUTP pyrophosphatase